jgi:hypothetical protein
VPCTCIQLTFVCMYVCVRALVFFWICRGYILIVFGSFPLWPHNRALCVILSCRGSLWKTMWLWHDMCHQHVQWVWPCVGGRNRVKSNQSVLSDIHRRKNACHDQSKDTHRIDSRPCRLVKFWTGPLWHSIDKQRGKT